MKIHELYILLLILVNYGYVSQNVTFFFCTENFHSCLVCCLVFELKLNPVLTLAFSSASVFLDRKSVYCQQENDLAEMLVHLCS